MGAPNGEIPERSVTTDQVYEMQYYEQAEIAKASNTDMRDIAETARSNFHNTTLGGFLSAVGTANNVVDLFIAALVYGLKGITGGLIDLTGYFHDEADLVRTKPGVTEVPIRSPMWQTMSRNEESTFPRANLNFGAGEGTASGGSGDSSHTHAFTRTPDYQPQGNGNNYIQLGFIRVLKDGWVDGIGLITGDSATALGIGAAYIALYKQNDTTGAITCVDTAAAVIDRKSSLTTALTESVFALSAPLQIAQDETYAVGVLQVTGLLQTPGSLLRTSLTKALRAQSTAYPRLPYCYVGPASSMPTTIAETSLIYDNSNKLPFFYMRRLETV